MPKKVVIRDEAGAVLGKLTVPDGATKEEIAREYAKAKQVLLAKRTAKLEEARVEPRVGSVLCSLCRTEISADQVGSHVRREAAQLGIDVGDGSL